MSFMDRPIRNLLLPLLTLYVAFWLRPILQKLPTPNLPKAQLHSLNGTALSSDSCRIINNPSGSLKYCEDILQWKEANLAIVSCDGGRPEWNTVMGPLKNPDPRGKLFAYNTADPHNQINELELGGFPNTKDFHPLGLQLHIFNQASARLFVVNHRRDKSVIEIFKLRLESPESDNPTSPNLSVKWERSLAHDLIVTPNSIVSISSDTLLVTNDHYFNLRTNPFLHHVETWLSLRTGNIIEVRFTDQASQNAGQLDNIDLSESENVEARKVVQGIPFANGLTLSPDRSTLVVAGSMLHSLWYYHRVKSTASKQQLYTPVGSRSLNFAPDNIHFDRSNRLIVAGHPHGLTLVKFSKDVQNANPAGSTVAVVLHASDTEFLSPHATQVREIFVDDGDFFASSSSALILTRSDRLQSDRTLDFNHSESMIVTGLYQTGLLQCDLS